MKVMGGRGGGGNENKNKKTIVKREPEVPFT